MMSSGKNPGLCIVAQLLNMHRNRRLDFGSASDDTFSRSRQNVFSCFECVLHTLDETSIFWTFSSFENRHVFARLADEVSVVAPSLKIWILLTIIIQSF